MEALNSLTFTRSRNGRACATYLPTTPEETLAGCAFPLTVGAHRPIHIHRFRRQRVTARGVGERRRRQAIMIHLWCIAGVKICILARYATCISIYLYTVGGRPAARCKKYKAQYQQCGRIGMENQAPLLRHEICMHMGLPLSIRRVLTARCSVETNKYSSTVRAGHQARYAMWSRRSVSFPARVAWPLATGR